MPDDTSDRRAELMAGALSASLSDGERDELESMMRTDPSIAVEMAELDATVQILQRTEAVDWIEDEPGQELREHVIAAARPGPGTATDPVPGPSPAVVDLEGRRRTREPVRPRGRMSRVVSVAAGVVAGVAITAGAFLLSADRPPSGPPGTLGAVEELELVGEPAGVDVDGALIAHTWGTETVLEVDGLEVGESYVLVLVDDGGAEFASGAFLGSEVTIECRMNAAVMRRDAVRLEIRTEDGGVVVAADLPDAEV